MVWIIHHALNYMKKLCFSGNIGAGGGTRTRTGLRPREFKSHASTIPPRPRRDWLAGGTEIGKPQSPPPSLAPPSPGLSIAVRRSVEDLAPHQRADQIDHQLGGAAPLVQERVQFDQVERGHQAAFVQKLANQMRLAEGGAAGDGGADGGRDRGVEEIHVQRHMQHAVLGLHAIKEFAQRATMPRSSSTRMSFTMISVSRSAADSALSTLRMPNMQMFLPGIGAGKAGNGSKPARPEA